MKGNILVELEGVSKSFDVRSSLFGAVSRLVAVSDVSFAIGRGESVGLVGESGCGKSSLGKLACGLLAPDSGRVLFEGKRMPLAGSGSPLAGRVQMVFQDPFSSLNPRMRVGESVAEVMRAKAFLARERGFGRSIDVPGEVSKMFEMVGLAGMERRYPHEFSGGQRQRIAIARALATKPDFVVCDEPVSALDASVQAQVLNLMLDLQERMGQAFLFISHNFAVVGFMCQKALVMYLGEIVEELTRDALQRGGAHPYTRALYDSIPDAMQGGPACTLEGELPSPLNPPSGCRFHSRCPRATVLCSEESPSWRTIEDGWRVRCHFPLEG